MMVDAFDLFGMAVFTFLLGVGWMGGLPKTPWLGFCNFFLAAGYLLRAFIVLVAP